MASYYRIRILNTYLGLSARLAPLALHLQPQLLLLLAVGNGHSSNLEKGPLQISFVPASLFVVRTDEK